MTHVLLAGGGIISFFMKRCVCRCIYNRKPLLNCCIYNRKPLLNYIYNIKPLLNLCVQVSQGRGRVLVRFG